MGEELERMHPKLYSNICRQVLSRSGSSAGTGAVTGGRGCGELQSPENAAVLLSAIARELFRTDITWGKVYYFIIISLFFENISFHRNAQVVSLFAISGGLAVDCVRQAHPDFIPKLIDAMADVIEDELVAWISENGGWVWMVSLPRTIKPN